MFTCDPNTITAIPPNRRYGMPDRATAPCYVIVVEHESPVRLYCYTASDDELARLKDWIHSNAERLTLMHSALATDHLEQVATTEAS